MTRPAPALAAALALLAGPAAADLPVRIPRPDQATALPPDLPPRPPPDEPAELSDTLSSGFTADVELRVRSTYVNPLELGGTDVREVMWTEQRLRADLGFEAAELFELKLQTDVLSGVLWGDNGVYGGDPSPNSGVALATKKPNATGWNVGLTPGADPLDRTSYVPGFAGLEPLRVNHLYADLRLPIGLLRIGRQPFFEGATLTAHDGARRNRWGASNYSDSVDRVLFATKLDAAWDVLVNDLPADPDPETGVFFALFYDLLAQGALQDPGDDARQLGASLFFRVEEGEWLGGPLQNFVFSTTAVHVGDRRFGTDVWGFPLRLQGTWERYRLELQYMPVTGTTREISEGFAALTNKEAVDQEIRAYGARGVLDARFGPATLTFELDWASGDDDPRSESAFTAFSFARDLNVGLLLFEHVLAFESARSAAVGSENLASLGAKSFPITEVATEGRFTNALAIFPQVRLDLLEEGEHRLHTRSGVLMAWPDANGVVDPILTAIAFDGDEVSDDAVNFHGGEPGTYYGTELDQQIEWTYRERFVFTLEGALLFPGDALQNEFGDAVPSFLTEARFTFLY